MKSFDLLKMTLIIAGMLWCFPVQAQSNLLTDPGFENDGQGWQRVNNGGRLVVTTEFHSGTKSQQMVVSDQWPRPVQQDVAVVAGASYDAAGWIKTSGVGGNGSMIILYWLNTAPAPGTDPQPSEIVRTDTLGPVTGTQNWTQLTGSYTAPSGAIIMRFYLLTDVDPDNAGTAWFDDHEFIGQPGTGLMVYLKLDDGQDTIASDASGYGNDGILYNGPTWTTGKVGGALDFDGVDDYISIPANLALDNLNALTFAAWIYPRQNSHWHIIDKGDGDKRLYAEGTSLTLDGRVRDNPTHAYTQSADSTVKLNAWQHVLLTWSLASDTVRLYYNGAEVSYQSQSIGSGSPLDDSGYPYTIGARGALGAVTFFDGLMDEVQIYNRALTAPEVLNLYNSTASLFDILPTLPGPQPFILTVFSNPFTGTVTMDFPGLKQAVGITVHDVYGRTIAHFKDLPERQVVWNARDLPAGIYLIKAARADGYYFKKVMIF